MAIQVPAQYNFTVYKGSYFSRRFLLKRGEPLEPIDLTGYSIRAQIRAGYGISPKIADFTIAPSNLSEGEVIIELYADVSTNIKNVKGVWDLELVPPSGEKYTERALMGDVLFSPEVTTGEE